MIKTSEKNYANEVCDWGGCVEGDDTCGVDGKYFGEEGWEKVWECDGVFKRDKR